MGGGHGQQVGRATPPPANWRIPWWRLPIGGSPAQAGAPNLAGWAFSGQSSAVFQRLQAWIDAAQAVRLRNRQIICDNHHNQSVGRWAQAALGREAIREEEDAPSYRKAVMELNRNQFLLIGLVLILLGVQLRMVDTFVLNEEHEVSRSGQAGKSEATLMWTLPVSLATGDGTAPRKKVRPPRWLAFAPLSVGGVLAGTALAMKKPVRRELHPTRNTVNDLAPCAPITSDCSMSAVFEGPDRNRPNPGSAKDKRW